MSGVGEATLTADRSIAGAIVDRARRLRARHALWFDAAVVCALLASLCWVVSWFDHRLFNGVSVWTKPLKFSVSLAAYFATFVWFTPLVPAAWFRRRAGRVLSWSPVVCAGFELTYICVQAALGQASHFNFTTVFHAVMFSLMGVGALVLVLCCAWLGVMVGRARGLADPFVLSVVLGLLGTCVLGGGFGAVIAEHGSHWVGGAATDAHGLPVFKWVRDGGDLRVAHFFGMHAMQALPLFALAIGAGRRHVKTPSMENPATDAPGMSRAMQRSLVLLAGIAYTWIAWETLLQALAGRPFLG